MQECVREFKLKYRPGDTLEELLQQNLKKTDNLMKSSPKSDLENKSPFGELKSRTIEESKVQEIKLELEKNYATKKHADKIHTENIIDPLLAFRSTERSEIRKSPEKNEIYGQTSKAEDKSKVKTEDFRCQDDLIIQQKREEDAKQTEDTSKKSDSFVSSLLSKTHSIISSFTSKTTVEIEENLVFTKEIPAKILPKNEISEIDDLEVNICNYKVTEGGFLSSSFVEYEIETIPVNWKIKRRYKDFLWLRDVLIASFPGIFIPPIPGKKSHGNLKDTTINKRKFLLNKYIKSVIRNPILKRSEAILAFLRDENFENYKERYKFTDNCEFKSENGKIGCDLSDKTKEIDNIAKYLSSSEALRKKLSRQGKTLISDIHKICEDITVYADLIEELSNVQGILPITKPNKETFTNLKNSL